MISQMKTSNKLLVALGLGILLLVGLIQLVLYSNYRQGRIISAKELHAEKYVRYEMPAPAYLSLTGTLWVNIIPSDTFYVEFPKENKLTGTAFKTTLPEIFTSDADVLSYRQSGDTLLITGNNTGMIHRPFADPFYRNTRAQVNIYCRGLKDIFLKKGQLYLQGAGGSTTTLPSARLHIDSSTLWIGDYREYAEYARQPAPKEFFDSLEIQSTNSVLLLNTSASIHKLQAQLDEHSEINDRQALIDRLTVSYDNDSRIGLTGANLKKAQLVAH